MTQGGAGARAAGRLRRGRAAGDAGVRRAVDQRQGVHGRAAAGAALPSIRIETPQDLLRLRGEVFPRRHALLLPLGTVGAGRRRTGGPSRSPPSRPPAPRVGTRGLHDGRRRPAAAAGDQHHPGHDQPQPRADGGARGRASISRSWCGACSRPVSRAGWPRRAGRAEHAAAARRTAASAAEARCVCRRSTGAPSASRAAQCSLLAGGTAAVGVGAQPADRDGVGRRALPACRRRRRRARGQGAGARRGTAVGGPGGGAPRDPHAAVGGCGERAARLAARTHGAGDRAERGGALGRAGLLNTRGELFAADERHMPPELAQLRGPTARKRKWRSVISPPRDG